MNWQQHTAISDMLVATAETLAQNPHTALAAGELIWGATFHACSAAERHPNEEHRQPRTRRELAQVIDRLPVDRQTRRYLLNGIDTSQRTLHDNFYSGRLSNGELTENINDGMAFVSRLLQIASQLPFSNGSPDA